MTTPAAHRALKKLPRPVREHLYEALQVLATQPQAGASLEAPWRFLRSFHTIYQRTQYRVVYEVDGDHQHIIIHYAASRENFYKELRRLQLKPVT